MRIERCMMHLQGQLKEKEVTSMVFLFVKLINSVLFVVRLKT